MCMCLFNVEGLTLSLPLPEAISLQPIKAPGFVHDQAPDHPVNDSKSLCMCHLPFVPFHWWLGTIIHHAKREDIKGHTPSIMGAYQI